MPKFALILTIAFRVFALVFVQFSFNPDWFEDEEGSDEEDWDLTAYRKEKEDADKAAEDRLIQRFNEGFQSLGSSSTEAEATPPVAAAT